MAQFYTPMIIVDSGGQVFVGDFIKLKGYSKVEKFALEVHIIIVSTIMVIVSLQETTIQCH